MPAAGNVKLNGQVSAEAAAEETVTITVTRPDSVKDTITALTAADGTYSASYTATQEGGYIAVAAISADNSYGAASSGAKPFDEYLSYLLEFDLLSSFDIFRQALNRR